MQRLESLLDSSQWFSNLRDLEHLQKTRFLVPIPMILIQEIWGGAKNVHSKQAFTLSPR